MKWLPVVGVTLALVGCTASPPDEFTQLTDPASCGEYDVIPPNWEIPDDAGTCLHDAVGVRAAELVLTQSTTEGDPITSYFRTSTDSDEVMLYVDATQDSFGSGEWHVLICPADVDPLMRSGCTE